ncbi:uncharacterized protein Cda5 isoform X1 [Fopius arisanus]|uniref:Cht3_3 protein n=2 Tax=Fopius arisanus TaxID=64838 RepID=A0A0C9Q324_9HYME|nr:PREDICTED: uncharacterized protein LOC105268059 isoform X1 [Fopius arisanus]
MLIVSGLLVVLAVVSRVGCQRNTPRSPRASRNDAALEFECPEEFGYYAHPRDCTQYYVCVFGGALLESCTGGLMYSHELQTCDWPRNVGCLDSSGGAKEDDVEDPLLERAAKDSHHRQPVRQPVRQPSPPSPSPHPTIADRHSRHRQPPHRTTYPDDEYEPASEIESDRQQRVYRGQPSTIGQVQRDRDGLRRNIISVSPTHPSRPLHPAYVTPPASNGSDNVGHVTNVSSTTPTIPPITTIKNNISDRDRIDYSYQDATRRNYIIVSSPSPFKLPPKIDDYTESILKQPQEQPNHHEDDYFNYIPERITDVTVETPKPSDLLSKPTESTPSSTETSVIPEITSKPEDSDQNEIQPTPAPRKRFTYEFSDEPIAVGNFATAPTTIRQRIKSRLSQYRGSERYQGGVTMMKIVRKRPVNDQIATESQDDVPRTTPMPRRRETSKKLSDNSDYVGEIADDVPTTLSPLQRAHILSKIGQLQSNEDIEGNEITISKSLGVREQLSNDSSTVTGKLGVTTAHSEIKGTRDELDGNEITVTPTSSGQRTTRHRPQASRSSLEREKESLHSGRGQTENHYRAIPSENPRIVKTTASTAATPVISKSYYDPETYPYYTIYDDDVSIYKDDDYAQYTVNHSVPLQHPHQHQSVRIAEVTPNSKATSYTQKAKKVPVNDNDKYNLNQDVTVSDYDIYDNQGQSHLNKNKFRIDGQSYRTNGISHPAVHVTTPNAIVDSYVPLTTTTQPPPTTTARPFTVTVQSRGRPQVNRGTAPPRSRPTLKPSTEIVSKAQEFVDIYRHPPARPPTLYPTPQVDKPAAKCRKDVCLLPDCNCGGADIPGDYLPEEIPQIVLLTFDDSVNDLNKGLYSDLFEKGRKNPNGCPISATFYVSHEWTDYSQVQNLYATGHEIASHTVSHSFGEQFSARKWAREIAGQREILAAYGGVKLEDVRGMRAPFLSVGGNNMFKMLWETNFTYDSSMPIYENRPPSWPYTLDYKLFHDCMIPPCPTRSYPGLWEVPMVMWQDLNGGRCSMGDACSNPPTPDGVYKMLIKNFERHYTTNRAPFGLFYHAAWFTQPHHKEGFISFLDTIVAMDDVWVVTNWQALQWVRNPTPLALLDNYEPFSCNYPDRPKKCNNAKVCNLWHKSGVRYMKTCQACPDIYPWTGKTGIRSSRIDNDIEN